jgi:type IX secretion system PorP/SprF family membrane protein
MKKIVKIMILLCVSLYGFAQQEIMISQYMFNGLFLNPAYAGSHPYVSTSLLHRSQWVNFDGAPRSQIFAIDGPVPGKNMGLGLMMSNDKIGVTNTVNIDGNYSYHIPMKNGKLAFGLRAGVMNYRANLNDLVYWDQNDQVYNQGSINFWMPKFGAGTYYFSERYYIGLSTPNLMAYQSNRRFDVDMTKGTIMKRHYFLTGGYVFDLTDKIKAKPSVLLKYQSKAPLQADLNFSLLFHDAFWIGTSFRTGDSVLGIIEYQANNRFRVGYAFDYSISKLNAYNGGSHEIMIGYDLGKELTKVRTPRFF